jgi:hypothetical protein
MVVNFIEGNTMIGQEEKTPLEEVIENQPPVQEPAPIEPVMSIEDGYDSDDENVGELIPESIAPFNRKITEDTIDIEQTIHASAESHDDSNLDEDLNPEPTTTLNEESKDNTEEFTIEWDIETTTLVQAKIKISCGQDILWQYAPEEIAGWMEQLFSHTSEGGDYYADPI